MSQYAVISGTGLTIPPHSISNEELVESFNSYVDAFNHENHIAIAQGEKEALTYSSVEFIEKASGIKSRFVYDKAGILDPKRMRPNYPERGDDELSLQAESAIKAIEEALQQAGKKACDVDMIIAACSNFQRSYPAVAIEIQHAIGASGYAYDMNVACSAATFAIQAAADAIKSGSAKCVIVVNPEITSAHLNWRDRDSHFIFGDACTAMVIESEDKVSSKEAYKILGTKLQTQFSNNIRNNLGFVNRCEDNDMLADDKYFVQQGRKVFKDVCPMAIHIIKQHTQELSLDAVNIQRFWLHQANINMLQYIVKKLIGTDVPEGMIPIELDRFANTSSAAAIIAFHTSREGLNAGDKGVICSFGAGYSIGSVIVEKI